MHPVRPVKINNSYESEPSSGSGSSLSEPNDYCNSFAIDAINFQQILKPPSYSNEVTVITTENPSSSNSCKSYEEKTCLQYEKQSSYISTIYSGEESPFKGFDDSTYGKKKVDFCAFNSKKLDIIQEGISKGRSLLPNFFDTLIEENSCNAVDMQLPNENISQNSYFPRNDSIDMEKKISQSSDTNLSSELSFNGKIKNLTANIVTLDDVENQLPQRKTDHTPSLPRLETPVISSQHNQSFILKKYSNEKSPDLFGEDDDDDDDDSNTSVDNSDEQSFKDNSLELSKVESLTNNKSNAISFTEEIETKYEIDTSINKSLNCPTESSFADDTIFDETTQNGNDAQTMFHNNCKRERELLKRTRKSLAGLPPPPSLTIPQLDLFTAVLNNKKNILNFFKSPIAEESDSNSVNSLLKPTHTLEAAKSITWRDILGVRYHGLCYNLNKSSESNEYLSLAVIERYIGAETKSSFRNSPSSAKKRNLRMKLLPQSPGNRLSHLAKRRAIFSSANLATTSQKSNTSLGPQIVINKDKHKKRRKATPKRMTINNTYRKTPTSSARKRLYHDLMKPVPSRETSKRALFQSPAKKSVPKNIIQKLPIKPEIANRVEKSKRALFSPETSGKSSVSDQSDIFKSLPCKNTQFESVLKRKRIEDDDNDAVDAMEFSTQRNKQFRSSAENLTPRALKIKSQSFCIGAGSSFTSSTATTTFNSTSLTESEKTGLSNNSSRICLATNSKIQRAHSDMVMPSNSLTENQRKKLLWAVSQALQEKKITAQHTSFKQFASVLARVVRRIFQEFYQKSSTSNSETMLRLAKKYVYNVVSGKTADDIYFHAKAQIDDNKRLSCSRLSGYIPPDEYQQRKNCQQSQHGSLQNLFSTETSIDSFSFSHTSSGFYEHSTSQSNLLEIIPQDDINYSQNSVGSSKLSSQISQSNSALPNSSSKNNLGGLALRENVDCELRRSAQKNFTGLFETSSTP
ncbi:uncharacterized protein LOC119685261 isoform X2 [Teleopsis dalmanni]|uniref:uncharacterized protein LOC119685261 isoform X2 n=1 Tax=Teleopsis dalmanni TaxID=139649 RepID=UPI0018CE2A8C|nr:uncharacterized protein LOC119685261 isoform X2 [Teleopsis dalmanni]